MKIRHLSLALFLGLASALVCSAQNRLKDKPTASTPAADDWLYLDGATNGVRKLAPSYFSGGGGSGTVTSVALALPSIFSVSGSPVTTTGTLTGTLATQSANLVWAGPTTGAAAAPTFRSLVAADIPSLSSIYQPADSDLTTWAGLTPSANAQSLVTAANYSAMRTLLSLVPGTNFLAYPTGTPTGSKYLRDDNSWQTITGGGDALTSNPLTQFSGITATNAEVNYLSGVTSAIQTQLNAKQATLTLGTGVQTALGVAIGSAGAPVLFNGAGGTPSSLTLTNATGLPVTGIVASTSSPLGVGTVELGHATDTTLSRSAAGVMAVEGVVIPSISSTNTLTNKRISSRVTTITSSATPTINTDNCDAVNITAQAAAITSMTTNLTGTPQPFDMLIFRIKDDGTARAITWGASFASRGATLPTTTVLSKVLYALFIWNSGTSTWDCVSTAQET